MNDGSCADIERLAPATFRFAPDAAVGLTPSPLGYRAAYFAAPERGRLEPEWLETRLREADECLAVKLDGVPVGWLVIRRKPWETDVFGLRMAEVSIFVAPSGAAEIPLRRDLLGAGLALAKEIDLEHLTCRVPTSSPGTIHCLEAAGFRTVDTLLTLSRAATPLPEPDTGGEDSDLEIRLAYAQDLPELEALAEHAFTHDRFHTDPWLSRVDADRAHRVWVRNSVNGEAAEQVLVLARRGSRSGQPGPARGFLTLARQAVGGLQLCVPGLGAVHEALRGRGWGRRLASAAVAWAHAQDCQFVEISTQAANVASARTHLAAGFKLLASSQTLALCIASDQGPE